MQTTDEVYRSPCLKENTTLGCGALFSISYLQRTNASWFWNRQNLNDVSSHIQQRASTNLDLRAFQVKQNLLCNLNKFHDYEIILRTAIKTFDLFTSDLFPRNYTISRNKDINAEMIFYVNLLLTFILLL